MSELESQTLGQSEPNMKAKASSAATDRQSQRNTAAEAATSSHFVPLTRSTTP